MSKIAFARENGADCVNPNYAWSYVNHVKRFVMFGADKKQADEIGQLILSESWRRDAKGNKTRGFNPSLRHIEHILEDDYQLYTFEQELEPAANGIPITKKFTRELIEKKLYPYGENFYAIDLPEKAETAPSSAAPFFEGSPTNVVQTIYERNTQARSECIKHYGATCEVCTFDFGAVYGEVGQGFIHVHHLIEVASRKTSYQIDPILDLRPVCPNCHAMLHKKRPAYGIEQLKEIISNQAGPT